MQKHCEIEKIGQNDKSCRATSNINNKNEVASSVVKILRHRKKNQVQKKNKPKPAAGTRAILLQHNQWLTVDKLLSTTIIDHQSAVTLLPRNNFVPSNKNDTINNNLSLVKRLKDWFHKENNSRDEKKRRRNNVTVTNPQRNNRTVAAIKLDEKIKYSSETRKHQ